MAARGRDVVSWRPVTVSEDGVTQVPKAPHRGRMTQSEDYDSACPQ
jgi:hypothetical protein